jgi:hypothetical protein
VHFGAQASGAGTVGLVQRPEMLFGELFGQIFGNGQRIVVLASTFFT